MAFHLTINDLVARTGVRTAKFTIPGPELLDDVILNVRKVEEASRNRFIVLSLPKHIGQFMTVTPDLPKARYKIGREARGWVADLLKLSKEQIAERTFVVVEIVPPLDLGLSVAINTDHPAVVKVINDRDTPGRISALQTTTKSPSAKSQPVKVDMRVDVIMVDDIKQVATSQVNITFVLLPMQNMPVYSGYAALDFGNTSSALVLSDTDKRDQFELVAADDLRPDVENRKPVLTALGISKVTLPSTSGAFFQYEAKIGATSLEMTDNAWLVLGAKRLLSDRKAGAAGEESVAIGNDIVRIPAEDAAEVFISQMLQGLFFHRQAKPRSIAVTCPTTFTASEVARLKRTVARAFHRVTDGNAGRFRDEAIDAFVPLVIDEASAAAFYFAYRDFIMGPGQAPAFRYLYPNGLHMLIYDCGGGTTDLALVRLEARTSGQMDIRILGRAGHRHFGGDFITRQVFRLLKAKLAAAKQATGDLPKSVGQLAAFLDANEQAIDRAVPTKYDRAQQQNAEARQRRQTALDLWQLAEKLKVRLSGKGVKEVRPEEENNEFGLLGKVLASVGWPDGMEDLLDVSGILKVSRQELDTLIDPEIDHTIAYANDLIRDGLETLSAEWADSGTDAPLEIPEVDRVYVVGNASRYPRIRERMLDEEHGLRVRFLEERLADVKPEDFKNSVAKGAIVAQRLRDMYAATRVAWDEDFMNRLPFDVISETLAHAGDSVLFRRGQPYSKELVAWREIAPDARSGKPTTQRIRLDRRWPGEKGPEPCLLFQFAEPVAGRFVIRYDEELRGFVMHPDRKGGADDLITAEPFEQSAYLAPPQSGRI